MRLEDVLSDAMSAPRQERCSQARLQIVLVCPIFLDRVLTHHARHGRSDTLGALLQTNRMLALLVGVTESDITIQHKTGEWNYGLIKYFYPPVHLFKMMNKLNELASQLLSV